MDKDLRKLLIDCANFIQPFVEGGDESEKLIIRIDEILNK